MADRPAEEPTRVQPVRRARLLHNEKYGQPPPGEEHLSGTHRECRISAELPLPCQTANDNGNGNPQAPDHAVERRDASLQQQGTSTARHGYNLRARPVGPTESEQSNRGLKRKGLDPCESLPDGKIHRLDDSGSMECEAVKLHSSGPVAPGNCGRPAVTWWQEVLSFIVDSIFE